MKKPELSIVVLTYNGEELLRRCIKAIDKQKIGVPHEKIVVDNGSDVPVDDIDGWKIIRLASNVGHIAGQNRCFETANGRWVLYVANDVTLRKGCVQKLIEAAHPDYPVQPRLMRKDSPKSVDQAGMRWVWPGFGVSIKRWGEAGGKLRRVDVVPGSCYLMSKSLWSTIGGHDSCLVTSHEDVDLCLRTGGGLVRLDAVANHVGSATLSKQVSHKRQTFQADRMYVIRKHYKGLDRTLRIVAAWVIHAVLEIGSVLSCRCNKKV